MDLVERGVPGNTASCGNTLVSGANCNTENYVSYVNTAGLCGYSDWRLPTRRELLSIVDYDGVGAIDTDYFPNTNLLNATGYYWAAESDVLVPGRAWYVHFEYGNSVPSIKVATTMGVRLVRGTLPATSFQDNGDGTVSDAATGLMWDQCAIGQRTAGSGCAAAANATPLTWQQALAAAVTANAANYLGYNDWRLPNVKELESLIAIGSAAYIDQVFFPQTPASPFWSSTTSVAPSLNAWYVDFGQGSVSRDVYSSNNKMARLVRGGQAFDPSFDLLLPATTALTQTGSTAGSASFAATLAAAPASVNATGYWLVRAATDPAPTPDELIAGAPGVAAGNSAIGSGQTQAFTATGLTPGTQYVLYYAAQDSTGNNLNPIRQQAFVLSAGQAAIPALDPRALLLLIGAIAGLALWRSCRE